MTLLIWHSAYILCVRFFFSLEILDLKKKFKIALWVLANEDYFYYSSSTAYIFKKLPYCVSNDGVFNVSIKLVKVFKLHCKKSLENSIQISVIKNCSYIFRCF